MRWNGFLGICLVAIGLLDHWLRCWTVGFSLCGFSVILVGGPIIVLIGAALIPGLPCSC